MSVSSDVSKSPRKVLLAHKTSTIMADNLSVNGDVPSKRPRPDEINTVSVVLGAQWGDEGKGKIVDLLATKADIVCRCQVSFVSLPRPPCRHGQLECTVF